MGRLAAEIRGRKKPVAAELLLERQVPLLAVAWMTVLIFKDPRSSLRECDVGSRVQAHGEWIAAWLNGPGVCKPATRRNRCGDNADCFTPGRIQNDVHGVPESAGIVEEAVAGTDRLCALAARIPHNPDARRKIQEMQGTW